MSFWYTKSFKVFKQPPKAVTDLITRASAMLLSEGITLVSTQGLKPNPLSQPHRLQEAHLKALGRTLNSSAYMPRSPCAACPMSTSLNPHAFARSLCHFH